MRRAPKPRAGEGNARYEFQKGPAHLRSPFPAQALRSEVENLRCHVCLGQRPDSQNSDHRQQRGHSGVFLAVTKLNFHDLLYAYRSWLASSRATLRHYVTDRAYEFQMEWSALL